MVVCTKLSIVFLLASLLLQESHFADGQVLINEVAAAGATVACSGAEYIELSNIGVSSANLSSYLLHNNLGPTGTDAFTLPSNFVLSPGEIRLICHEQPGSTGSFRFHIGNPDSVTLLDANGLIVATTGNITTDNETSSFTYQLSSSNNTYVFSSPTPGTVNFVTPTIGNPIIFEVAPLGTSNISAVPCAGGPFVEIFNDAFPTLNLAGYVVTAGLNSYTFLDGSVSGYTFFTLCTLSLLTIGPNDNVSISTPSGMILSSTGPIGGSNPSPSSLDLTWVRVTDFVVTSAPFTPFYQYSTNPSPNAKNVFPFVPIQLPIQPCGIQAAPLPMLTDYELKQLSTLDVNGGDPELSGATFDPRTCNYLLVGDNGFLYEVATTTTTAALSLPLLRARPSVLYEAATTITDMNLLRARPLVGGSRTLLPSNTKYPDAEGICFYSDAVNGDKIAILDERDRSVYICDIPTTDQLVPLFLDSPNCRVAKLTPEQISNSTLTNVDDNGSFEGLSCDPLNGKLYIATEESPMIIWSVDFATGIFTVLIDVQRLPSWTDRISDIAGMTYDPLSQSLYVVSDESKVVIQSSLNGTIIGGNLSVAMLESPGGLSFDPVTGDLIVFGEPNMTARFSNKQAPIVEPPVPPNVVAPVPVPVTFAPIETPVFVSTDAPVPVTAPTLSPVVESPSTETVVPVGPDETPTKNESKEGKGGMGMKMGSMGMKDTGSDKGIGKMGGKKMDKKVMKGR